MEQTAKISVRNVWKVYGEQPERYFAGELNGDSAAIAQKMRDESHIPACVDVSFEVASGENFVIMGLSGSGKSTVVRCITRLVEPTSGQVFLDGEDILAAPKERLVELRRHKMGMVFQNFGLLPHLTVLENVAFPLKVQGVSVAEREATARQMIELVSLDGRENAYPRELSGGQQQRVGIARSLAVEPDIWLLDEPFSALDPLIRRQMQDEFLRLQKRLQKTIVFITHDFLEAIRIADRICIMKDGQIAQIGTADEIILQPANDYVADFTGDVPLGRALTVGSVMQVATQFNPDLPTINRRRPLDDAFRLFEDGAATVQVLDGDQLVGIVTPRDLVLAMAKKAT